MLLNTSECIQITETEPDLEELLEVLAGAHNAGWVSFISEQSSLDSPPRTLLFSSQDNATDLTLSSHEDQDDDPESEHHDEDESNSESDEGEIKKESQRERNRLCSARFRQQSIKMLQHLNHNCAEKKRHNAQVSSLGDFESSLLLLEGRIKIRTRELEKDIERVKEELAEIKKGPLTGKQKLKEMNRASAYKTRFQNDIKMLGLCYINLKYVLTGGLARVAPTKQEILHKMALALKIDEGELFGEFNLEMEDIKRKRRRYR